MPHISQGSGGYRVQVKVRGRRASNTLPTRKAAQLWASQTYVLLRAESNGTACEVRTTHDALRRYRDEVSPTHRGARWERLRLEAMLRRDSAAAFPNVPLAKLDSVDIERWRDWRLSKVSVGTVLRELGLLNAVWSMCCSKKWRWLAANPAAVPGIKPKPPKHRTRTIKRDEIRKMLRAFDYPARDTARHAVAHAFLLALRTGLRAGELAALRWEWVHPGYIALPAEITKADNARDVALSRKATRLINKMRGYSPDSVYGVTAASIDVHYRNARTSAGLSGFTFHDTRHTAATWIGRANKIGVMDLCKMFGWSDPKMAMIYFNPSAADIAARL